MDTPVGAGAAGLADAGAIGKAQSAAGPAQIGARNFRREQVLDDGRQKYRRLVQPVFDAGILKSAMPSMDAQAAVWRNDNLPGPRASAIRSRLAPSTTSRLR